jgi:hypothetical protein
MNQESADQRLDALLASYRRAAPDPEPGVNFMPDLWGRIDAQRSAAFTFRRIARVFVSAAAALCIVMAVILQFPAVQPAPATYIEALDDDQTATIAYADVLHGEPGLESERQ